MRINLFLVNAVLLSVLTISCIKENDYFLRTLSLTPVHIEAADSINIDRFNLFQVRSVVALEGGWLLLSSVKGDYKLMFLNRRTSEHFFAIRRGRGPGEMINGNSLHRYDNGAAFYDSNSEICVKLELNMTEAESAVAIDTIGVFSGTPSKPVYMTTCGHGGFVSGNLAILQ